VNVRVNGVDPAREAALYAYAHAHDRFFEREQVHRVKGETAEAEGAHVYAMWCLRAYRAELDEPLKGKA
jgi:hypothetical protein